jgi:TPR repeat protein
MLRGVLVVAVVGCSASPSRPTSPPPSPKCLADDVGVLRSPERMDTSCLEASCKQACDAGNADGCMMQAYELQRTEADDEAQALFGRACKLGLAIGCTNFGANLFIAAKSKAEAACPKRLFEKACAVRESFGCGMVGRLLANWATTDDERTDARLHFERVCHDLGSVTCRMYALHIENGDLPPADPERVKDLLRRACDTGDDDACDHETAGETFH